MKKKFMALAMTIVMGLSSIAGSVCFADTKLTDKAAEKTKIMRELKALEKKYDVVFTETPDPSLKETLSLQTVADVEAVLKQLKNNKNAFTEKKTDYGTYSSLIYATAAATPTYNASNTVTWWAPFSGWGMTGMACWKNISYSYTYY